MTGNRLLRLVQGRILLDNLARQRPAHTIRPAGFLKPRRSAILDLTPICIRFINQKIGPVRRTSKKKGCNDSEDSVMLGVINIDIIFKNILNTESSKPLFKFVPPFARLGLPNPSRRIWQSGGSIEGTNLKSAVAGLALKNLWPLT